MSSVRSQIGAALKWAPYSWIALPILGLLATLRYGWPAALAGWLPYLLLLVGLVAVERGCPLAFSFMTGARSDSRSELGQQLTLAFGFALVLWVFREFMSQSLP